MKVYIVQEHVRYEGSEVLEVFRDKNSAMAFAKNQAELYAEKWSYPLLEISWGFSVSDVVFDVSECDVIL